MITRKVKTKESAVEKFVNAYLSSYIGNLQFSQFIYLDEVYRTIANRLANLRDLRNIEIGFLDDYSMVKSDLYVNMFNKCLTLADMNYKLIPEVYTNLKTVVDDIVESSEYISGYITNCSDIVKALEGNLRRKVTASSVKNEVLTYDTIGVNTFVSKGGLSIDKRAGQVTLSVHNAELIPFTISSVILNKPKGYIEVPKVGNLTWDPIKNGYFTSRTFSDNPAFENEETIKYERMNDDNLETSYLVEYNSTYDRDVLKLNLEVTLDGGRVDMINIVADPSDMSSVTTSSVILPKVGRILCTNEEGTVDVTSRAVDNTVVVRDNVLGSNESTITHKKPDVFPIGSFFIGCASTNTVTLELESEEPQEIYYSEKVVGDGSGNILHRFNYFETLVLNKYQPSIEYMNPLEFYTQQEVTEMNEIVSAGNNVYDERSHLFRYFIGVKELQFVRLTYVNKGSTMTSNLNTSSERIAACELYVNEYIPDGTGIEYFVSVDRVDWYPIAPISRAGNSGNPRRYVFDSKLKTRSTDKILAKDTEDIYMKISMTGTGEVTPVLKAYAMRIKLV